MCGGKNCFQKVYQAKQNVLLKVERGTRVQMLGHHHCRAVHLRTQPTSSYPERRHSLCFESL